VAWEPAFGRDFECTFLHALSQLGKRGGTSAYFRLSTRPLDQSLAGSPERRQVLAGGYRLREGSRVTIAAMGAVVPEALAAAEELDAEVVCVTSADLLFRAFQARAGLGEGDPAILDELFPRAQPVVCLLDGHPHTLSFLGAVRGVPVACLGVQRFGQSGDIGELYEHHQIDAEAVIGAALDLLG
jgi:pyruvate dehydrogenase E1 component